MPCRPDALLSSLYLTCLLLVSYATVYRLEFQYGFSVPVSQLEGVCGRLCSTLCLCCGGAYFHAWKSQVLPWGNGGFLKGIMCKLAISYGNKCVDICCATKISTEVVVLIGPGCHLIPLCLYDSLICSLSKQSNRNQMSRNKILLRLLFH